MNSRIVLIKENTMIKFIYNLFLILFVIKRNAIRDVIAGTAIFLITGKTSITVDEYKSLKRKVMECDDFDFFLLGMKLGKFFYRKPICKVEDKYAEVDSITERLLYECFQNAIECNLTNHIKNLCINKQKISNIICHC